jgi:hypothetical protein
MAECVGCNEASGRFEDWLNTIAEQYDHLGTLLGIRVGNSKTQVIVYFEEGLVSFQMPVAGNVPSPDMQSVTQRFTWSASSGDPIPDESIPDCFF